MSELLPSLDRLAGPSDETTYSVAKSVGERRYTFGPLYSPGVLDAHGEWAEADDLQKALWDYMRQGDLRLRKQHGSQVIGEVVELVQWPYNLDAKLSIRGLAKSHRLPAGTVYAGIVWAPSAWEDVKAGRITGLSMGGRAVRVEG